MKCPGICGIWETAWGEAEEHSDRAGRIREEWMEHLAGTGRAVIRIERIIITAAVQIIITAAVRTIIMELEIRKRLRIVE